MFCVTGRFFDDCRNAVNQSELEPDASKPVPNTGKRSTHNCLRFAPDWLKQIAHLSDWLADSEESLSFKPIAEFR